MRYRSFKNYDFYAIVPRCYPS